MALALPVYISEVPVDIEKSRNTARTSETPSEILQGHLTFRPSEGSRGSQSLQRGIRLNSVVRRGAALLSNSNGSVATYELSSPVDQNDYFLSHNWSVTRWRKYLSLILHFNEKSAICAAFLSAALCFSLEAAGVIPLPFEGFAWCKDAGCYTDKPKAGICVRLVTAPVFLLVLFFKYDVAVRPGWSASPGPMLFLDKTCIHQVDLELQKQGIGKLGAFLKNSRRMLIIYSDVYLQKLWTVYEVACFLATSEDGCQGMKIVHISMAPYFLLALAIAYLQAVLPLSKGLLQYCIYLFLAVAGTAVFRYGHRKRVSACKKAKKFAVQEAMCFDESDRPIVEKIIVALMMKYEYVAETALPQEALEVFNYVVQENVFRTMRVTLGNLPFSTKHAVVAFCLTNFTKNLDRLAFDLREGAYDEFFLFLASCITVMLGHTPLGFALIRWITGQMLSLTGWKEWLYVSLCASVGLLAAVVFITIDGFLLSYSKRSFVHVLGFAAFNSASLISSAVIWRRRRVDLKSKLKEETVRKEASRARHFAHSRSRSDLSASNDGPEELIAQSTQVLTSIMSNDSHDQPSANVWKLNGDVIGRQISTASADQHWQRRSSTTAQHLKSGNLWKLSRDAKYGHGCQTSFHSWQCRSFTATQNIYTVSVQHLSEEGDGSVIEIAVLRSLTRHADADLIELAPVTMESLDLRDRLSIAVNMQEYQLIIGKPIHDATEDYCADIPGVLYPFCISGEDSPDEVQRVILAAPSAQEQQVWLSCLRKAMATDYGAQAMATDYGAQEQPVEPCQFVWL